MIAFKVPQGQYELAEARYLSYRLHTTCVPTHFDLTLWPVIIALGARPDLCPGCWDLRVEHDPGDEDRG